MKKLIVIADWVNDSLTSQEVKSAVEGFLKDPRFVNISRVASTPSTIHTSFLKSQVVETEERYGKPLETVILQNTDSRIHSDSPLEHAEGAKLLIVRLASGIYVCGPNAGYNFSLIKEKIDEVYEYRGLKEEGPSHSRDMYARIVAHLIDGMEDEMELEEIRSFDIPVLQGYYIGHIDSFGNLKTTITYEDFKGKHSSGDEVDIEINNVKKKAKYVTNRFGGNPGELVIYPGSCGPKDNPFLEITIWRHFTEENPTTGVHIFNNPRPGMKIEIEK